MHRVIVYPGALPQDTDILSTNLNAMIADGFRNQAILGSSTVVSGLACTPTSPASLQVDIATGSIFQLDEIDATAYGSLGTNTSNIVKQGILQTAQVLTITPPSTTGYSQIYLVQAILQDVDAGSQVLGYYNSANSAQPFSGPAGSGTSQYTVRQCNCAVALKAGVPATTGTEVAPSPDAGYVGLYTITVANGAASITSGNIVQLASAPFFPTLPAIPYDVLNGTFVYGGTDTGAANAYVITFGVGQPQPSAYTAGMKVRFKALNANTGASTINVNGLGLVTIHRASGVALASGDIVSGQIVELVYDGTYFQMPNYLGSGTNTNTSTTVDIPYIADSGTQNALVATYSPAIAALTDGLYLAVKLANAITGAATINVNGLGAKSVVLGDGANPPYNVFVAGEIILLVYSTTLGKFQIANTSAGMFYRKPTSNYNIYVNTSTGSDTLYDGTSATVGTGTSGPLKTIGAAITLAWSYAPSQYTITIQVANGTYNETVASPLYAGPNVIINGASTAGVVVNGGSGSCIGVQGPNTMTVQNLTVQNSGGPNTTGLSASQGATLNTSNTASNGIGGVVFYAAEGGTVNAGTHTFSGSCTSCFGGYFLGTCNLMAVTYTFSAPISVSTFAEGWTGGIVNVPDGATPTFVNASYVSGSKYGASNNGVVDAYTLGYNFLPGTTAGSTAYGGQYIP